MFHRLSLIMYLSRFRRYRFLNLFYLHHVLPVALLSFSVLVSLYLCAKLLLKSTLYNPRNDFAKFGHKHNTSQSALQLVPVMAQSYNFYASNQKIFRCLSSQFHRPADIRWNNNHWQNPENSGLFLYSAFYDFRMKAAYSYGHSFIRILAMHDGSDCSVCQYYCHIWFGNNTNSPIVVASEMKEIWHPDWDSDLHHEIYRPYLLSCIFPKKLEKLRRSKIRAWVSLSKKPCSTTSTYVPIQHFDTFGTSDSAKNSFKKDFVICVKPIDFYEDFSKKLVEWIEINLLLGINNIHIYKFKAHPNVDKVLNYYKEYGIVNVTATTLAGNQPNFPIERSAFLKRNLWQKRRNELLPYNDCFYKHLYSHKYVIPIDIDELIVPTKQRDLQEMVKYLEDSDDFKVTLKMYASFSVRNAYFFESIPADQLTITDVAESYFLKHICRSSNFSVGSKSMKSLVRTDAALTVFNHYVLDTLPGVGRSHEIPVELVQMNHYRSRCPLDMSDDCKNNFLKYTQQDTILWKYKQVLKVLNKTVNYLQI